MQERIKDLEIGDEIIYLDDDGKEIKEKVIAKEATDKLVIIQTISKEVD